ncbi:MAG: hypothetical protein ACLT1I_12655 [Mediterraneibacter faecis]
MGSGSKEVQEEEPSEIAAEETTPTPEVAPESSDSNTGQEEKTQDMTVYRYVIYILAGLIAVTLVVTIVSGIRKHTKEKEGENPDGFSLLFLDLFKHQGPMHRNHLHNRNRYGCWLP